MKRRDTLKSIALGSLGMATVPSTDLIAAPPEKPLVVPGGRQKSEAIRDAKLMADKFFTPQEMKTLTVLCDIILPADEKSGSASQAGVPAFIEFMVKDQPVHQIPLRGGLAWLDNESRKRFSKKFVELTKAQQIEIVDDIAYPEQAKPQFSQGVAFFNKMRDMTLTGFYTTRIGFNDLGYVGNTPNNWEGVPEEVLKQYGLSYE
ncbi:gluconate 2-dehydrogenase subunit 3 family protein [Siphonobacter sp. SORGH_AS_0500]|uniref:gluconate 2-dehydrogenase subunit 3 family protein n=1 Tax=Siphonobacter sp. SORGH_AS_0500 TaxID=1864824 RepID=UPI000CC11D38|nr:gluconate 2-dehydrogenase subunit 3 family protein [Siphonobacter sp. SORGH_AS_0500]MDR6196199.1 gluconate 2-dehydrogenase gamma chain [Siphonobacter sp. SORGH_AS_0500]PKK38178.1 transcriptional initiation protein Tat [Siphonobacter sp. SORGH_AS_0500]